MTPTDRTLKHLQAEGWFAGRVDCNNGRISRDLWGVIDIIAGRGQGKDTEIMAIQVTGGGNGPARVKKMERDEHHEAMTRMREWGWRIVVWDWRKSRRKGWWIWEADLS